jgi:hypothetical protein
MSIVLGSDLTPTLILLGLVILMGWVCMTLSATFKRGWLAAREAQRASENQLQRLERVLNDRHYGLADIGSWATPRDRLLMLLADLDQKIAQRDRADFPDYLATIDLVNLTDRQREVLARAPAPGSEWVHHTSNQEYKVRFIANARSQDYDRYPPTVFYEGANGHVWSRPVTDWQRSMTPKQVKTSQGCGACAHCGCGKS